MIYRGRCVSGLRNTGCENPSWKEKYVCSELLECLKFWQWISWGFWKETKSGNSPKLSWLTGTKNDNGHTSNYSHIDTINRICLYMGHSIQYTYLFTESQRTAVCNEITTGCHSRTGNQTFHDLCAPSSNQQVSGVLQLSHRSAPPALRRHTPDRPGTAQKTANVRLQCRSKSIIRHDTIYLDTDPTATAHDHCNYV